MSLIGIPPLSGFWAKLLVVRETLAQGRWALAAIALSVGLLTLYSMAKIWMGAFWKKHPDESWTPPTNTRIGPAWVAAVGLAAVTPRLQDPRTLLMAASLELRRARSAGGRRVMAVPVEQLRVTAPRSAQMH